MKKTLLLGSFAIFGLMANAQVVCMATAEGLEAEGFESSTKTMPAGTLIAESEVGKIETAFEFGFKTMAPNAIYSTVKVNDVPVDLSNGVAGDGGNATFASFAEGFTAGPVFKITPYKEGWVTVFTKMNPNKQFVVMENQDGAMSYTLGYYNGDQKIYYNLPATEDYYINFNAPDIDKYLIDGLVKPQMVWFTAGYDEAITTDATAFLTFKVFEEAVYYFCGLGTKPACGGFVFTEGDEEPTITYYDDADNLVAAFGEGAGVEAIEAAQADPNAPVYNLLGVKVDASYKGVVIKNGKKYIQK